MGSEEMIARAAAAIGVGQLVDAEKILDSVLDETPAHPRALLMRAVLDAAAGNGRNALERLGRLEELAPGISGSPQYLSVRAQALSAAGDYRAAIAHFARVFQLDAQHFARLAAEFVRNATGSQEHLRFSAPPSLFAGEREAKQIFTQIYERGLWGGGSGPGSHPSNSALYAGLVQHLIRHFGARRVVDFGCGDWQFSQFLDFSGVDYIGVDIVDSLVSQNSARYGASNVRFVVGDISDYPIDDADLVLCKDVLQHLDDDSALRVLQKLPMARAWLITNDYSARNVDGGIGDARPMDPTAPPFFLSVAAAE
jgi:2-polyprenyl-3-methyl-5-hydroxy-6-metoxy-1,4-benzoquinol methylase